MLIPRSRWFLIRAQFVRYKPEYQPEAIAESLLKRYGIEVPPVPVYELAMSIDVDVFLGRGQREPGVAVVKRTTRTVGAGKVVGVPDFVATVSLSPYVRNEQRRFAAARALGHILMHEFLDNGTYYQVSDRSDDRDPRVLESIRFADALLMPEEMVRTYAPHLTFRERRLAELFEVPVGAMKRRMRTLYGV